MEDLAKAYTDAICSTPEFQRLKELKAEIEKKHGMLIISMKTKEAYYEEAKEYPDRYDVKKAQREFMDAKARLYSQELVKEYFEVEERLDEMLRKDMEELMNSVSSHFKSSLPF